MSVSMWFRQSGKLCQQGLTNDWKFTNLGPDASLVASVPDVVGGNTASQATTGNKPTFNTNKINGLGAVNGNGSSTVMLLKSAITLNAFTLYYVGITAGAGKINVPMAYSAGHGQIAEGYLDNNMYLVTPDNNNIHTAWTPPMGSVWYYMRRDGSGNVHFGASNQAEVFIGTLALTIVCDSLLANIHDSQPTNATTYFSEIVLYNGTDLGAVPGALTYNQNNYLHPVYGF